MKSITTALIVSSLLALTLPVYATGIVSTEVASTTSETSTTGPFITSHHQVGEIIPSAVHPTKDPIQILQQNTVSQRQIIPTPFRVLYKQTLPKSWNELETTLYKNNKNPLSKTFLHTSLKMEYNRASAVYPVNDIADYSPFPSFPVKIPAYAKNVNFQAGTYTGGITQYIQLSFNATPEEAQSLINEAAETAQIITTPQEAKNFKVILSGEHDKKTIYTVADSKHPAIPLSALIPKYWVEVTSDLKDLNEYYTYWHPEEITKRLQAVDDMMEEQKQALLRKATREELGQINQKWVKKVANMIQNQPTNLKPMTNEEQEEAHKTYLGHKSYKTFTHNLPDNYTIYIYAYGGTLGPKGTINAYVDGLAVSPDKTHLIFYNIDTFNESLLVD